MVVGLNPVEAHRICNLKCNVPNEISAVFHTLSNYDYHFIITLLLILSKKLANKFEGDFECCGEIQKSTKPFPFQQKRSYKN